jgi:subtilisin
LRSSDIVKFIGLVCATKYFLLESLLLQRYRRSVAREEAMPSPSPRRYIIMPKQGFENAALKAVTLTPAAQPVALKARVKGLTSPSMRVLDSIGDSGPKLVEMPAEGELSLRLSNPELKIVPEVFYHRLWYRPKVEKRLARKSAVQKPKTKARGGQVKARGGRVKVAGQPMAAAAAGSTLTVVDDTNGKPLRGAHVVVFTDYQNRTGDERDSGANGVVRLGSISARQALERAYVYGPPGYWGYYATNTSAAALKTIRLQAINVTDPSLLLHKLYGGLPTTAGTGVTVGIVDSGVDGAHPDLSNVTGGLNCVSDEVLADPAAASNWGPAKVEGEHGTHVAGIIGATGAKTFRGVAAGVKLRSYRVFPDAGGGASNFDIAKAIDSARVDGCAIINMSLGGKDADDLTQATIDRALAAGVVVIAAAGNDGRQPVSYPAAFPESTAVSAMGRLNSFPKQSIGTSDIAPPKGVPNGNDFVADFSNFGSQIDATGPGVEIVSTLPGGQYGTMSGTSMATPAVTGFAAYLLGANALLLQAQGAARSQQLKNLLYASCKPENFGREYEGFGLPTP